MQAAAGFGELIYRGREGDLAIPMFPDAAQQADGIAIEEGFGGLDSRVEIGSRMDRTEDAQEVLEIRDEAVTEVRDKERVAANGAFETGQALARDPAVFEFLVEAIEITARVEELEVSLADDDIIGGRVVMQFLMP